MTSSSFLNNVDVLIPVYNGASFLRSAILSIIKQEGAPKSIIVVDDGSTDDTPVILEELRSEHPVVQVIRSSKTGIVGALNLGLSACESEFIARHDADDLAYPHRLRKQLQYLYDNPDCVAVGAYAHRIDESGRYLKSMAMPGNPNDHDASVIPAREPYLIHPFLMVRRSVIKDIGGYRDFPLAEDADLYWRLAARGRLHNIPEPLGKYRVHQASSTSKSIQKVRLNALSSQLSAISAQRRARGQPDLVISSDEWPAIADEDDQRALAGRIGLSSEEQAYLDAAVPAKLLELVTYRRAELTHLDCAHIRDSYVRNRNRLTDDERRWFRGYLTGASARLALTGRINDAVVLSSKSMMILVFVKIVSRVILPIGFRVGAWKSYSGRVRARFRRPRWSWVRD